MSNELDQRLTDHLRDRATSEPVFATEIDVVRRVAKRRTMRTRIAVGTCGVLALAGLGSLVPTRGEPNALITANDPTPVEQIQTDDDPVSTAAMQSEDEDKTSESGSLEGEEALPPPGHTVIGDGQGGFIGIGTRTSRSLVRFVRSDDGEDWLWANDWQLPDDRFLERLQRIDDTYVAVFDTIYHESQGTKPVRQPELAVSDDLVNWEFITVPLGPESPIGGATHEQYYIGDIAVNDRDVLFWIGVFSEIDYEKYDINERDICGASERLNAISLTLCDGSILAIDDFDEWYLRPHERVFLSKDFGPAATTPLFDYKLDAGRNIWTWWRYLDLYRSGLFFDATYVGNGTTTPAAREELQALLDDPFDATVLTVTARSGEERLLLVHTDGELVPILQTEDEARVGTLPADIQLLSSIPGSPQVATGPAGWAMAISDASFPYVNLARDGWELQAFGASSAQLRSADNTSLISYNSQTSELPPAVQLGLFGGVRYFRPGTSELLFEISADEAEIVIARSILPDDAAFDQSLTVDGWTISGHPIIGPLFLTSPTGETREFADGFAFDNDDISDGVEMALSSNLTPNAALRSATPMQFFDDAGNMLVEFRGRPLFDTLVVPVLGHPTDERGADLYPQRRFDDRQSWVLFSADGVTWEQVWTSDDGSSFPISNLVVGDEEILIAERLKAMRIPIPVDD